MILSQHGEAGRQEAQPPIMGDVLGGHQSPQRRPEAKPGLTAKVTIYTQESKGCDRAEQGIALQTGKRRPWEPEDQDVYGDRRTRCDP
jgi:hypothetical protein